MVAPIGTRGTTQQFRQSNLCVAASISKTQREQQTFVKYQTTVHLASAVNTAPTGGLPTIGSITGNALVAHSE